MSATRNTLALIGAITVATVAVKVFNKHIRKPLVALITEALDAERERENKSSTP